MENKKVLVVDDEFTIRYLVEHQLNRNGFESIMAKDGPSGLIAAHTHQPDLIVLDIMMPDMDGFDVCRELKEDPVLAQIPVIFLTALSSKSDKQRAFEMGASDYLTKPFQADEFVAHVTAVLRQNEQSAPSRSQKKGRIAALFSPKGGVGTSTLAVQLSEALVLREGHQVALIDLDLPLGGIAPMLNLYTTRHIVGLLNEPPDDLTVEMILKYAQRHRADMQVIPAPGFFMQTSKMPFPASIEPVLELLSTHGYHVILDLGANLTALTFAAMKKADKIFTLTSGTAVANRHLDTFLSSAGQMGLDPRQVLPVINQIYGETDEVRLARVPFANIPHVSERSRTRLWLQEQGLSKLASAIVA